MTVPAGIGIDTTNPAVVSDEQGVGLTQRVRQAVHLAAAHARDRRRPAHRDEDAGAEHARPVLRPVGRRARCELRRRVLRSRHADRVLRRRGGIRRRSARDRARRHAGDRSRHRHTTRRDSVRTPPVVAVTDTNRVKTDDAKYVLHSWSVQSALDPIPVAGGEGRYFWDYDGKRYLDFASQLVNVSLGHQHPKVVAAIKEQAEHLCTIGPTMANEPRSELARLLAEVTPATCRCRSSRTAAPRRTRTRSSSPAGTRAARRSSRATARTTGRPPARSR